MIILVFKGLERLGKGAKSLANLNRSLMLPRAN